MEEIPGKREITSRWIHDGYEYHVDTTHPDIFRCSIRSRTGCLGSVRVDGDGRVHVRTAHQGHQPNPTILEEARMRREMLQMAAETNISLKEIFDTVCRRNPIVAPRLLYNTMKSAMHRARAKVRPLIPGSLRELGVALDTYEATAEVYRGLVEGDDGTVALIFASNPMLEALGACGEIYIDGTFKVAPYVPVIAQLYTIHMRVMDAGIAAVYILCGARTRLLYRAIFSRLAGLAPGLVENLRFVMGDFERAAMSAVRDVFPNAALYGCWFHFNQALERRWKRLGLSDAPRTPLAMAMSLPLAPADRFQEGLALLANAADEIAENHPAVLQFIRYLRTQWGPLAEIVSVHGCPARTNNLVESFHNEARRKLGGLHPNVWRFIEHLKDLIENQAIDLIRLRNGERARRPRTLRNTNRDALIRDAQHDLNVGRFTLLDFLRRCATRAPIGVLVEPQNGQAEDEEPEVELVEPGLMNPGEPELEVPVRRGGRRGRVAGNANPRGRGGRPRVARARAEDAGLEPAVEPEQRDLPPVEVEQPQPPIELIALEDEDEDVFRVPEDDFPLFAGTSGASTFSPR